MLPCTDVTDLGKHLVEKIQQGAMKDVSLTFEGEDGESSTIVRPGLESFFWETLQVLAAHLLGR